MLIFKIFFPLFFNVQDLDVLFFYSTSVFSSGLSIKSRGILVFEFFGSSFLRDKSSKTFMS